MTTNLNDEALVLHHVRLMAETLKETKDHFCNTHKLTRRPTQQEQLQMMLELISREPRPMVEYLTSGLTRQRRAEIVGEGTKKNPYRGQWKNDYYTNL